jgi:hypothetical protein
MVLPRPAARITLAAKLEFSSNDRSENREAGQLARAANLLIGRAAFETARRMYPKDLIEYRRGAQVLDRSKADE